VLRTIYRQIPCNLNPGRYCITLSDRYKYTRASLCVNNFCTHSSGTWNTLHRPSRDFRRSPYYCVAGSGSVTNVSRKWCCWLWECYKCVKQVVLLALKVLQVCQANGAAGAGSVKKMSRKWCCWLRKCYKRVTQVMWIIQSPLRPWASVPAPYRFVRLLQWRWRLLCYTSVTLLCLLCYTSVTLLCLLCYTSVTLLWLLCYTSVTLLCLLCYTSVTLLWLLCYTPVTFLWLLCYTSVTLLCLLCYYFQTWRKPCSVQRSHGFQAARQRCTLLLLNVLEWP
jgi:hypothetical protein